MGGEGRERLKEGGREGEREKERERERGRENHLSVKTHLLWEAFPSPN